MAVCRKFQSLDINDLVILLLLFASFYKSPMLFLVVWSNSKFSKKTCFPRAFYSSSWVIQTV